MKTCLQSIMLSFSFFLMATLCGCKNTEDNVAVQQIPLTANFLFAITHDNYAFLESHTNVYITIDGSVYQSTDNPVINSELQDNQIYSASFLHQRFEYQPTLLAQVSAEILSNNYLALLQVDPAQQSEPVTLCADFGSTRFWGLIFDANTNEYRARLLAERGDIARFNGTPEAVALTSWLVETAQDSSLDLINCQ